ncbi:hypothetical protein Tco_0038578 [Tanacetum coccineum]
MPTEMELTLEQTQQGVSYEVSVNPYGFEGIFKDDDERQSVKVKEIQERCIIKAFQDYQIKKGMSMSVQKSQVHEMAKFTRWRNEIMLG